MNARQVEAQPGLPPAQAETSGTADVDGVLEEVVRRIVEMAHPRKIILFGSAARHETGPQGDLDLMVVAEPGTHRRRLAQQIYQGMIGVGHPVDIVVVTPEDIRRYGQAPGLVIEPALREGIVVYEK